MAKINRRKKTTPAQELESRLFETAQRNELIIKVTNDVMYDFDVVRGVVKWNDAFYEKYGYPKKDYESGLEWWASHIHPDDALKLEREYSEWFDSNQDIWEAEYRYLKADGNYIYIRDRGLLQRAADGSPLSIIGSFLDITAQAQLDRAKDEFISLVSHQLRTPLTVLRMYGDMLLSGYFGSLTGSQRSQVKKMTDASVRLIGLVGDILDTSRIELGHVVVNPVRTDVNEFIKMNIEGMLPMAAVKDVSLRLILDANKIVIPIDVIILGRMLHNLITNGIRYTKAKAGFVEVAFRHVSDGYLLTIRDNGIGISRSDKVQVFKRFFRGENSINVTEQGAGLGLYIVKHIAEAAGCKVWFKSTKGRGVTFYIHIPPEGMKA
jgi:two-component system CheB/CheR fusion protein